MVDITMIAKEISFFLLKNDKRLLFYKFSGDYIRSERTRIWNVVELYNLYNPENEASSSSWKDNRTLLNDLLDYFDGVLVSFHTRGYAKLVCFKDHAH